MSSDFAVAGHLLCSYFLFKQLLKVGLQGLVVEDQCQQDRYGRDQYIARYDQPEPGPIFFCAGKFAYGYSLKEFRSESRQELTDGIGQIRAPDVRCIFKVYIIEIAVAEGDKAQLRLEHLVEHDKEHQKQQTGGGADDPFVRQRVMTEHHHQQRQCRLEYCQQYQDQYPF